MPTAEALASPGKRNAKPMAHFANPPVTFTYSAPPSRSATPEPSTASSDNSANAPGSLGLDAPESDSVVPVDTSTAEIGELRIHLDGHHSPFTPSPPSGSDDDVSAVTSSSAGSAVDAEPAPSETSSERTPAKCLYVVSRELGTGTYSVVKEARHVESDKWYAAKVINKRLMRGREHLVRNEIIVLKRVSRGHPNILTLVDYFETDNSLYLITELAKGGELFDRLYTRGSFYESDAAKIVKEITSGVAHLHEHGIVHRDLKPENLLFKTQSDRSNLLICDFGLSRIIDEENFHMLTTTVGTPSYMAPEIFTESGHGKPVDIWAIGIITYFLLCGYTPFDRETAAEEREAIIAADVKFEPQEYWIHVSSDALNFIRTCLQLDPSKRPTANELMSLPFLTRRYRKEADLLPHVMSNLSLRQQQSDVWGIPSTLEGLAMNGAYSCSPDVEAPRTSVFSAKWG